MAVNGLAVACPQDIWVKVATNVTSGRIYRRSSRPGAYIQDVKVTSDPAPVDQSNAAPIFEGPDRFEDIGSDSAIDVYVMAKGNNGAVTVHL